MAFRTTVLVLALALFAVVHGAPPTREELGERAEERAAAGAPHMPVLPRMKADFEKIVELRKEAGSLGKPMLKEGAARLGELAAKRAAPSPEAMDKLTKFAKGAEKRKDMVSRKAKPALPEGFKAPPAFAKGMKKMEGSDEKPLMMGADKATWSPYTGSKDKWSPVKGSAALGSDKATYAPKATDEAEMAKFTDKMNSPKRTAPPAPHVLGERLGKDAKRIPKAAAGAPHMPKGLEAKAAKKTTAPPAVRERSVRTPPPMRAAPRDAPLAPPAPLSPHAKTTTAPAEVRARAAEKKFAPKFDGKEFKGLTHKARRAAKGEAPAHMPTPEALKAKFGAAKKVQMPEFKMPASPPKVDLKLKAMDVEAFKAKLHASLDRKVAEEPEKVEA